LAWIRSISRSGILLINLGSPEAPTEKALRTYLAEFLWDKCVVDLPRLIWWPILHGIILRTRPARSAGLYAKIWTDEGSPLTAISRRLADALEGEIHKNLGENISVELSMRYGISSVQGGMDKLRREGCENILIMPLYPQYSGTTTVSSFNAVKDAIAAWPDKPKLRFVRSYYDHPEYISALAGSVRNFWQERGEPQRLLISFHGIPRRYAKAGDPYPGECQVTARLLAEELGLGGSRWAISFQSRFGPAKWLQPYTSETLTTWGGEGVEGVDVICPGFAADCLETLEEIAMQNRLLFEQAGGRDFRYIPALNDSIEHIKALSAIIAESLNTR